MTSPSITGCKRLCTFISRGCFHLSSLGHFNFHLPHDRGSHHRVHDFERCTHRVVNATKKTDDDGAVTPARANADMYVYVRDDTLCGEVFLVIVLQVPPDLAHTSEGLGQMSGAKHLRNRDPPRRMRNRIRRRYHNTSDRASIHKTQFLQYQRYPIR